MEKASKGNIFQSVKEISIPQSKFDLSYQNKLTCNMGYLIPTLCKEIVPGDKFNINTFAFMRFQPLVAPIMHNIDLYMRYFFVPYRLIWNQFEEFITGGETGNANPIAPYMIIETGEINKELPDYLGIPDNGRQITCSALPFRAYQLIYNEYFRDQNIQTPEELQLNAGLDTRTSKTLRKVCWKKDYFTSALPWAQKGSPVQFGTDVLLQPDTHTPQKLTRLDGGEIQDTLRNLTLDNERRLTHSNSTQVLLDPNGTFRAFTEISELRRANAVQRFLERNALGGSRYSEFLLSHFGVTSQDSRLQRPEYLGGGSTPVVISEVLQNSSTDETSPQGNLAGKGTSAGTLGFNNPTFFTEHGLVMGLMYIRPQTDYFQGLSKMWFRNDKYDYYFPEFANLGEQEIKVKELYAYDVENGMDDETFGYQSRYAEYKYYPNEIHGDFRGNLSFWHLGRILNAPTTLNSKFITCEPRNDIFAVTDPNEHKIMIDMYHNIEAIRPMPRFGEPNLI